MRRNGRISPASRRSIRLRRVSRQILAHRAAQAAARQFEHLALDEIDEVVVDRDLADLVDDDGGVGKRRVGKRAAQQRRLAAAEKPGQQRRRQNVSNAGAPFIASSKTCRRHRFTPAPCGGKSAVPDQVRGPLATQSVAFAEPRQHHACHNSAAYAAGAGGSRTTWRQRSARASEPGIRRAASICCSTCAWCRSGSAACARSRMSRSRSGAARSPRSSARTAPARPRCST